MVDPRDEQREWLRSVLAQTKLAPGALAKKAGVAAPTLTVFLNSSSAKHALSARTIAKIADATGIRFGPEPRAGTLHEAESAPYVAGLPGEDTDMVRAALAGRNAVAPWTLRSRALECAGYMPGDTLLVDINATPQPGDIACAQIYDYARAIADTVFRIYEPPYLVAATFDRKLRRPLVVDKHIVDVRGVVVASVRSRQARAA